MKILLADDHALFRDGMRYVLQQLADEVEVIEAPNFPDAMRQMEANSGARLVLLDLNMPGSDGAASVKLFTLRFPEAPVVVVSGMDQRDDIERVMESGAVGFISKTTPSKVMLNALRLVMDGGIYVPPQLLQSAMPHLEPGPDRRHKVVNSYGLTNRQTEALTLLAHGLSNKEIAEKMGLAEGTVKIHIAAVYQVLRVTSRFEAMRVAEQLGLISAKVQ